MKTNPTIRFSSVAAIAIAVSLILSGASKCNNGTGWNSSTGKDLPSCNSLVKGETKYAFNSVNLRYSLKEYYQFYPTDVDELIAAHGLNSNLHDYSGSIIHLSQLLQNNSNYSEDRKSSITAEMRGTDCRGSIKRVYKSFDDGVSVNTINIPNLFSGTPLSVVHAEAKSIKTAISGLRLVWSASVDVAKFHDTGEMDGAQMYSLTCHEGSATKIYLRMEQSDIYSIVGDNDADNTVIDFSTAATVECPSLKKAVFIGGVCRNDIEWDAPIAAVHDRNKTIPID